MSVRAIAWAWDVDGITPTEKLVLLAIADNADDDGYAWPGVETLCAKTCLKRRAVLKALGHLESTGFLERSARYRGRGTQGGRTSNGYRLRLSAPRAPNQLCAPDAHKPVMCTSCTRLGALDAPHEPSVEPSDTSLSVSAPRKPDGAPAPSTGEEPQPSAPTRVPPVDHRLVVDLYHEILPELPAVVFSRFPGSAKGGKALAVRWREDTRHQAPEFWRWFFQVVRSNPHWLGDNNRGWRADLRWLLKRENFDRVIERGADQRRRTNAA